MPDVYLHHIACTRGSLTELNDAKTLGQSAADCERINGKTGIQSRPIVSPEEFTSELATRATRDLLQQARIPADAVDSLIVCTQTPDHLIPGVSSRVHGNLGFSKNCFAVDINQGCSGFIYGTQMIAAMLRSGSCRQAILVNADCYSRLVRPGDLTTRVLFGDAAAASVFTTQPGGLRLVHSRCYSDGSGYEEFVARNSGMRPDDDSERGIYMNGPGILSFALRVVPEAISDALSDTGLSLEKIRIIAFHQANSFVIGKLAHKLHLRPDQVPQNCSEVGNTVSASIPMLLFEQIPALKPGDLVMAVGFGVGLSWGVAVFEQV
jgi:3-oxoacyl-[acyl-carrier-protein] synthase III